MEIEREYINDKIYKSERIILGLRLLNEGIDISFDGQKHQGMFKAMLLECLTNKTLERYDNKIKLAEGLMLVFNQIVLKFME